MSAVTNLHRPAGQFEQFAPTRSRRWYVTTLGCEVVAAADFDAVVDAGMKLFAENERLRAQIAGCRPGS